MRGSGVLFLAACGVAGAANAPPTADAIVVGAGVAGLSASLESARAGLKVTLVDRNSVFGGHSIASSGGMAIVGSPLQSSLGIADAPDLAYRDFLTWGEDANPDWARYYSRNSRRDLWDWLTEIGVDFSGVSHSPGNSVPRFHGVVGAGLGLVRPLYRAILREGNVEFVWNTDVTALTMEGGRVTGVAVQNLRTGQKRELKAHAVVLATGGYENSLELVRKWWPKDLPLPERVLLGSGVNSTGSGLALARAAGAAIERLDHQWNYPRGLADPRDPSGRRGLLVIHPASIWVNAQGRRFVNEEADNKEAVAAVTRQKPARFWMLYDSASAGMFRVILAGFRGDQVEAILSNPTLVPRADSLAELAARAGLPAGPLADAVARYNAAVDLGEDADFGRFRAPDKGPEPWTPTRRRIEKPPFYAVPLFILSRKSMGGIRVDASARALNQKGAVIPGLFAAGEAAGFGGINGKAGLEGTFLGPAIVMGQVAARTLAAELKPRERQHLSAATPAPRHERAYSAGATKAAGEAMECSACHDLPKLVAATRPGYWHFEQAHKLVAERSLECVTCHAEMKPFRAEWHKVDRRAQADVCGICHEGGRRRAPPTSNGR